MHDGPDNDSDGLLDLDLAVPLSTPPNWMKNWANAPMHSMMMMDSPTFRMTSLRGSWRPQNPMDIVPSCSNGLDDDGDSLIDFPLDPGCSGRGDPERIARRAAGGVNEVDDDGDGHVDFLMTTDAFSL